MRVCEWWWWGESGDVSELGVWMGATDDGGGGERGWRGAGAAWCGEVGCWFWCL